MSGPPRAAAFLDRDGTIIREAHYLADPDRVELVPGAAAAIRALAAAGYVIVIVTNQSGIARGLYGEPQFRAVQDRLEAVLAAQGAVVDAVFHCPHHPAVTGECDCRKPRLGMYIQAASALNLDLAASIYAGDRVKDVLPAIETGGRGFLVLTGYGTAEAADVPAGITVVADLAAVAAAVLRNVDTRAARQ
jgi:D-glycero-D-manno-heptose 1,7-bisphosphate phosphatase